MPNFNIDTMMDLQYKRFRALNKAFSVNCKEASAKNEEALDIAKEKLIRGAVALDKTVALMEDTKIGRVYLDRAMNKIKFLEEQRVGKSIRKTMQTVGNYFGTRSTYEEA